MWQCVRRQLMRRGRFTNWFLRVTVGYDYNPWRVLWLAVNVVVAGWAVFLIADRAGVMIPMKEDAYAEPFVPVAGQWPVRLDYPPLNPLLYSVDVFLPVVSLRQDEHWGPGLELFGLVWLYMKLHNIAGWILTSLLLVAPARLIGRD